MGASESLLSRQQLQQPRPQWADEITTVSEGRRDDADADPLVRRIRSLTIAPPLLSSQSEAEAESSLTDILVGKPSNSSATSGNLNPNVLAELFAMYREWQEENAKKISRKQEEIENKIETADALAVKLLQRFNYCLTYMRSTSHNLAEVHPLQIEVGESKGRLTEVISNCDALCKRIAAEGPESLRSSVQPFMAARAEAEGSGSLDPKQES
ncbi:hypothetical protein Zm00014a_032401 [Zea mays]|uniref:Uncharacterized protein n=2 Tax=Zea mays TaxID=4577 RepID=A0A1D6L2Y8_MAIZE|nr:uncharacterized protein LOC100501429 [Zea mays]ONM08826.1 hypothetical protein ZEAMMB73_Zm00001d033860 [Zea mays]PWZ55512.1 hypothetical protein Zm00014a_032401 [Zea mays]|eukprot:XP_008665342.2 uncharacterized protein LOC100501429 [Zea mays]